MYYPIISLTNKMIDLHSIITNTNSTNNFIAIYSKGPLSPAYLRSVILFECTEINYKNTNVA